MVVVMAKYLKGEGGGGTFMFFEECEREARTLSREALQGCAWSG